MTVYDWIQSNLQVIKERQPELYCVCPQCGDAKGKFSFNVERGVGRCWRAATCNYRTTLAALIVRVEELPWHLAARKAASLKANSPAYVSYEKPAYDAVGNLPQPSIALEDIERGWEFLSQEEKLDVEHGVRYLVEKRNQDFDALCKAKLAVSLGGNYKGRIIIPAIEDGTIVSVTSRTILIKVEEGVWLEHPKAVGPKYLTASSEEGYLEKEYVVYNIDTIRPFAKIAIVEDSFSVHALQSVGVPAISLWGMDATAGQLDKINALWSAPNRLAVIMLDPGTNERIMSRSLAAKFNFCNVAIADLTTSDADEDPRGAKFHFDNASPFSFETYLESFL